MPEKSQFACFTFELVKQMLRQTNRHTELLHLQGRANEKHQTSVLGSLLPAQACFKDELMRHK